MTNNVCTGNKKKSSLCRFTVILKYYKYIQQSKLNSEDKITSSYKMLAKGLNPSNHAEKMEKTMNNYKELWNSVKSNIS